jgi:hypothetical protein
MGNNRDGRWVGFNDKLKLVIKIFSDENAFSQENQAYKVLSESGYSYVPQFYGSFENDYLSLWAIIISYEGPEVDGLLTEIDRQEQSVFLAYYLGLNERPQGKSSCCSNLVTFPWSPPPRSQT